MEGWAGEQRGALKLWFWLTSGGTLWMKMPIVYWGLFKLIRNFKITYFERLVSVHSFFSLEKLIFTTVIMYILSGSCQNYLVLIGESAEAERFQSQENSGA